MQRSSEAEAIISRGRGKSALVVRRLALWVMCFSEVVTFLLGGFNDQVQKVKREVLVDVLHGAAGRV